MKNFKPKITKVKEGSWTIFLGLCKGCGICLEKCPTKALIGIPTPKVNPEKCSLCGICELNCPDCAIKVDKKK